APQALAAGSSSQHRLNAYLPASADLFLDEHLLAQALRQILSDDACHGVVWPAGSERHDPMYRPRRIGLRPYDARDGRQRGSNTCQMQKLTAGEVHFAPLWKIKQPKQARPKERHDTSGARKEKRWEGE